MNKKAKDKQKTNTRLREALARLIKNEPTNRELKARVKLKVNPSTVEKEAGTSVGALKHHGDVLTAISVHNTIGSSVSTAKEEDETSQGGTLLKIENLKTRLKNKSAKLKKETEIKMSYKEQLEDIEKQRESFWKEEHELIQALFSRVSYADRDKLFKKKNNVTTINFQKK